MCGGVDFLRGSTFNPEVLPTSYFGAVADYGSWPASNRDILLTIRIINSLVFSTHGIR